MAGEAIVLLGASDRYAHALHALHAWTQAPQMAPFALLDATLALDSDGSWLRQALPPVAQRLRDAVEMFASDTTAAAAYAGDVEGCLKLTGYAGDAAATAQALRCRAVDTLTDGGKTLAAPQVLTAVKPPDLARRRNKRPAPDADLPVRPRWESGVGHAVLLNPWMATPRRMIVQPSPTQSTPRLHMEKSTTLPSSPLSPSRTGLYGRCLESAPNTTHQRHRSEAPAAGHTIDSRMCGLIRNEASHGNRPGLRHHHRGRRSRPTRRSTLMLGGTATQGGRTARWDRGGPARADRPAPVRPARTPSARSR